MCGIAGVVSWSPKYRVTRELLSAMSGRIAHRGPDGEGIFLTREQEEVDENRPQAGFAFRRLAILDPDPRAMQPFTIGKQTIVFNGEIYNFRELRAELTKVRPEYAWRTTGDTEVLLLSYATWGEKCLEKLNGMFALAVWDEEKGELFLARDRMGQKPLYVAMVPQARSTSTGHLVVSKQSPKLAIAFASEIAALMPLPWVNRSISPAALRDYLSFGYQTESIYAGIGQIEPHHCVSITARSLLPRNYFWPNVSKEWPAEGIDDTEAAKNVRNRVACAVRRQLISDVPLGCFLSGGIDSSVIAACMRSSISPDQPVMTFCAAFTDRRYDESSFADAVARHLGTQHRRFVVEPNAIEDLPKIAAAFSEPFGDSSALPTYYLARHTRQFVKVCLSGDGGDELFGGYDRYRAMRWSRRLQALAMGNTAQNIERLLGRASWSHPKGKSARIRRFLRAIGLSDKDRYQTYMYLDGQAPGELIEGLIAAARNPPLLFEFAFRFAEKEVHDVVRAALAADRRVYLPYDLLTKVDRCSMAHNLEVRSPFMDHDVVRLAAGLTTDQLLKGGPKRMLREAFAADLPDFVFKRKKMGFAVPIGDWLRKELRPMLHDHLFAADSFARVHFNLDVVRRLVDEHESFRVDHSQRLYALLMLELWHRGNR